jgi:LmbE family N-acetylglucosaminyl deacetylase
MVKLILKMNTIKEPLTIMAFFAHPDDETMFLGGTLAYLTRLGAKVHFISATRGEGGEMGDPPVCQRSQLGDVREEELRCAVNALGGVSLDFLGFKDPVVGPEGELFPFSGDQQAVVRELIPRILDIHPDVILSHGPGGEYGHPAHIQAHRSLIQALELGKYHPQAVYSPAWLSRETGEFVPPPDIVVDISPWIDEKIAAANCHRSQHGLFLRHGSARAGRKVTLPEMIRTQEALCRILPGRLGGNAARDPLQELVKDISMPDAAL